MSFTKKNVDDFLRIEDDRGGSVTAMLFPKTKKAQLLSVYVPDSNRRQGIAKGLIDATERCLATGGFTTLEADFADELEDVNCLLESCGYELKKGYPLYEVSMNELLSSKAVIKTLHTAIKDSEFIHLSDMYFVNIMDVKEKLEKFGIDKRILRKTSFSEELSGAVFDANEEIKAIVLCNEIDDNVRVDFLLGTSKKDAIYIMVALKEVLNTVVKNGGKDRYRNLEMVGANEVMEVLLARVLDRGYSAKKVGMTVYAQKQLSMKNSILKLYDEQDDDEEIEWREEISHIPFQDNLWWKVAWKRKKTG